MEASFINSADNSMRDGRMIHELRSRLAALPSLGDRPSGEAAIPCPICGASAPFYDVTDFNKCADPSFVGLYHFGPSGISVAWHRCGRCEFLFTPFFDDWTAEDFTRFVYNADYVKVDPEYLGARGRTVAQHLRGMLRGCENARLLDYGSGEGTLAATLAGDGFKFTESYDPFSSPRRPVGLFDVITCFEVIEHSPNPLGTLQEMASFLAPGGCIIMGEALQPDDIDRVRAGWWYCAPRNGHCSTFTATTLAVLAEQVGLIYCPGSGIHYFLSPPFGTHPLSAHAGRALIPVNLGAPAENSPAWHGAEYFGSVRYRWSAASEITWSVPVHQSRALLRARLLYHVQPQPGFLDTCRFMVNGVPVTPRPSAGALLLETELNDQSKVDITLLNAQLYCPASVGSPDTREMGLGLYIDE